VPQIRPLADIVHYKYIFTYLLTYLHLLKDNCGDGQEHGIVNGMTVLAPDSAADMNFESGRHF